MSDAVQLNGPTLTLLTSVSGVLGAVILALFRLLLGRMSRAEQQVDTLLPATREMVEQVRGLREDLARSVELVRVLREDLARERSGRRDG